MLRKSLPSQWREKLTLNLVLRRNNTGGKDAAPGVSPKAQGTGFVWQLPDEILSGTIA